MNYSSHAVERCSQRGIPEAVVELVLRFGAVEHHRGSEIFRLDKRGLKKATHYLGSLYSGSREKLKEIYVVVNDETIVTVARQHAHHKRQRH